MSINLYRDTLQNVWLFGQSVLYTEQSIPREEVPEGWHCYDLKGSDANPGRPYEMVDRAGQDSAGSILSHIPLMRGRTHGKLVPNNFWMTAAPVTLADFCAEEGIPCPQPPEGVEYATEDPAEPRQPATCGWTMGMACNIQKNSRLPPQCVVCMLAAK